MATQCRYHTLLVEALRSMSADVLRVKSAEHMLRSGAWDPGVIRPSMIAQSCLLAAAHRYYGHAGRPNWSGAPLRRGDPNAVTTLNFLRGYALEAVVVSALRSRPGMVPMAISPDLVEAELDGIRLEAHPDLVLAEAGAPASKGLQLIQIKCPSVFAFEHNSELSDTYRAQVEAEMTICHLAGYQVTMGHVMSVSWEGFGRGPNGIRIRCHHVAWDEEICARTVDTIRELHQAMQAPAAIKPLPIGLANVFPCSYCQFSREPRPEDCVPGCAQEVWEWKM